MWTIGVTYLRECREEKRKITSERIGEDPGKKIVIGDMNSRKAEKAEEVIGENLCSKGKCINKEGKEFLEKMTEVGLNTGNGNIEGEKDQQKGQQLITL